MEDGIKKLAEQELGKSIADEHWTPKVRDAWKRFLHFRNYGGEGGSISYNPPQSLLQTGKGDSTE